MKKLLITTMLSVMLITPVMASAASAYDNEEIKQTCKKYSALPEEIMTERQLDVPRTDMLESARRHFKNYYIVHKMINKAYLHPISTTYSGRVSDIETFKEDYYNQCMRNHQSN